MDTQTEKAAPTLEGGHKHILHSNIHSSESFAIQDLARSGLTAQDAEFLHIRETERGYEIPYFYPSNKASIRTPDGREFKRTRLKNPSSNAKYLSPQNGGIHIYILPKPHHQLLTDKSLPLVITEGEKKTARAVKEDIPCVGIGGIWMWKNAGGSDVVNKEVEPYLNENRPVILIYDSDATDPKKSADFDNSAHRFAAALQPYGCTLTRLDLPEIDGEKVGLDDYLEHGYSAGDFWNLVETQGQDVPGSNAEQEWPDIKSQSLPGASAFPIDALPSCLGDQVKQVAETMQVAPEMPGFAALSFAGFTLGPRTYVQVKNGVIARPNLYTICFAPSGERKSSAYKPMTPPFYEFARSYEHEWNEILKEKRIIAEKRKNIEKKLSSPETSKQKRCEYQQQLEDLEEPAGTSPHFILDNVTQEALQQHLLDCGERGLICSADARDAMQVVQGLYNDSISGNADSIYLKGFDGDEMHIKRITRGDTILYNPCIGMYVCIQEDQLKALGENEALMDSGFLPRFILLHPDPQAGTRFWNEVELDEQVQQAYNQAIYNRLERYRNQTDDCYFSLDEDARNIWIRWYNDLESQLNGDLIEQASLAIRWQGLPLRIAPIIAEYEEKQKISADHMKRAIELSKCAVDHGKRCHQAMTRVTLERAEEKAVDMLTRYNMTEFTISDLAQKRHKRVNEIQKTLESLQTRGYVRKTNRTRGHKKAQLWEANPQLFE